VCGAPQLAVSGQTMPPLGSAGAGAHDERMTTTELAQTTQDRLDALHREIALLEAARDQLQGDGSGSARPTVSKPPAVRRTRRASPQPSGEVVAAVKLEGLLAEHGGITSTALAELAKGGRDQVLGVLRELEAAGRARRTGQLRGTRWHAITDEDRITVFETGPGTRNTVRMRCPIRGNDNGGESYFRSSDSSSSRALRNMSPRGW
jgi:hypothetical protein